MRPASAATSLPSLGRLVATVRPAWRIFRAEALKQHRTLFGSRLIYFSMLVWPALHLAVSYFGFAPFLDLPNMGVRWPIAASPKGVLLFVTTGSLAVTFFGSLVQSAWHFTRERASGTLELLFLSPANRLLLLMANGVTALVQNTWLFLTFTMGVTWLVGGLSIAHMGMVPVAFLALLIPAAAWGTFLNALFLFSRDSGFLFSVLNEPMEFAAGARIPPTALPLWARAVGPLFPLTTSLYVVRGILLEGQTVGTLWPRLLVLLAVSAGFLLSSAFIVRKGEAHVRRTGSLSLF